MRGIKLFACGAYHHHDQAEERQCHKQYCQDFERNPTDVSTDTVSSGFHTFLYQLGVFVFVHEQVVVNVDRVLRVESEINALKFIVQRHDKLQRQTIKQHVGDILRYQYDQQVGHVHQQRK